MKKLSNVVFVTTINIFLVTSTFGQGIWVTGKKISEGTNQYIQGQHVKECTYTVDYKFNFSITISEYNCPFTVQYNMSTKEVKY